MTFKVEIILLIIFLVFAGFFSAAETSMMSINRYRLRNLVRKKNKTAIIVAKLLERPDKVLATTLIGGTFTNIAASALVTIVAIHFFGNLGLVLTTIALTLVVLIFSEMGPKTLAASKPMPVAFACVWLLEIFYFLFYPLVWLGNLIVNNGLKIFHVKIKKHTIEKLTREEISTLVQEAGDQIPDQHQDMLLAILSLEKITVNDVMVPRNDIQGINLEDSLEEIIQIIQTSLHRQLPIYSDDINNVKGMLDVHLAWRQLAINQLTLDSLPNLAEPVHFIPEGSQLATQLVQFRAAKRRVGVVVDEYGDVIGLITLADMLEEIVGEFTTKMASHYKIAKLQADGSYLVPGNVNLRDLNKMMDWDFDTSGPKTLNGLITEALEMMPQTSICLQVGYYRIEVLQVKGNMVELARIMPFSPDIEKE